METLTKNKNSIEYSSYIYPVVNDDNALKLSKLHYGTEDCLLIERVEYGEVRFERKSDWMRLVNKLNAYDDTPIKRMLTGDRKKMDWGGCTLHRETIEYHEDGIKIVFDKPIKVLMGNVGEQLIIAEVTELKGKITWDWYGYNNSKHRELGNYQGGLEIWLEEVELIK